MTYNCFAHFLNCESIIGKSRCDISAQPMHMIVWFRAAVLFLIKRTLSVVLFFRFRHYLHYKSFVHTLVVGSEAGERVL